MGDINTCFATTKDYHVIALYSHLVPVFITLLISGFVLFKSKFSLLSEIFTLFTFSFCLWLLGDVITWTSSDYNLALFTFFAALGLPALSGFVAEMLTLVGAFTVSPVMAAISSFGVVITVGYCLWLIRRVFMGPLNSQYAKLKDLDARELAMMVPLVILVVWLGVYPQGLLNMLNVALQILVR
jgi:NADH:ubiquinone oxidoreductase subunit 4 (subunit M)